MWRWQSLVLGGLFLLLLGGCSQYVDDYQYVPRPALVEIPATPPQQGPAVTAFVSVIGVRWEDKKAGIPQSVEVRFRLDNNGAQAVTFDPQSLELTNGALLKFPQPLVRPPQPVTLAATQSVSMDANFPFPAGLWYGNTDLDALQLRWMINVDGHPVRLYADFHRVIMLYYNPYYGPYPPYGPYGYGDVGYRRRWR